MVAVSDFSGLISSAWALASAAASAATDSLDRGMGTLRIEHIESHRTRLRAPSSHAMPDGLLGALRHQCFELAFCALMIEKGAPGAAEKGRKLPPGIRRAHIDNPNGLDARPRRLSVDQV